MAKLNWTKEEVQALTKAQYDALSVEEKAAVRQVRVTQIVGQEKA